MENEKPVQFSNKVADDYNVLEYPDGVATTPTKLSLHGCVKMPNSPSDAHTHVTWRNTPSIKSLPGSIDDEFDDYGIVTTVDLSMIKNAYANSLEALLAKSKDAEVKVTEDNCLRFLECTAQNYAWGKVGSDALVARLKKGGCDDFDIDEMKPYAELWLGTHPNGMSDILLPFDGNGNAKKKIALVDYVRMNPELHLGVEGKTAPSDDYDITFLFKVLSIEKVLSIQAHPDKLLAAQLHTDHPNIYKDPNHKPEMAVALTDDFEAMSGFRSVKAIAKNLTNYPELGNLVGVVARDHICEAAKAHLHHEPKKVLQRLFSAYMEADDAIVQVQLDFLNERLSKKKETGILTDLDELLLKLSNQFPGDPGIFAPLLFNHLKLKKGEAFYIGANEPHAYIQGDILECMACSDNVVRAGLTPKLKDVNTLVKMLTYKCTMPEITTGTKVDSACRLYLPPVKDFAMEMIEVPPGESYSIRNVRSPSLLLVLGGSGNFQQGSVQSLDVSFGKTLFMSANTKAIVSADNSSSLKVVRALSNVF